jgi:4-hydroxy-3-methylbut-2-en-1-yl diphosphate synthase IspG/GcpE
MYRRQDGTIVIGPGEFTKADLGVLKQDSGDVIVGSGPGEMS